MPKARWIMIAGFLLLAGIGIAGAVHAPERGSYAEPAVSVMTFNVGDSVRCVFPVDDTARCVWDDSRPDILLLQETPRGDVRNELVVRLNYPFQCESKGPRGKLAGLMILSRFPVVDKREVELPSEGRGAGVLCAVVEVHGEKVLVCSVHLDEVDPKTRNRAGQVTFTAWGLVTTLATELVTDTVRTEAIRALMERIYRDTEAMPVIVAGDFNTLPGSPGIRNMGAIFHDVLWPSAAYFRGTYHKIAFPLNPRIDYIFVSDRFLVDHARIIQHSAGDHYPVEAWLRVR